MQFDIENGGKGLIDFVELTGRPLPNHESSAVQPDVAGLSKLLTQAARKPAATGRCFRTLTVKNSHHRSLQFDGRHEQAQARPLPHDKLVHRKRCVQEAWGAEPRPSLLTDYRLS